MPAPVLLVADQTHLEQLLPFVRDYHAFEEIERSDDERRASVGPLLANPGLGRVWLVNVAEQTAGYIALCFGYSIEMGGRDAFVDEFFLTEEMRGHGIGRQVLADVKRAAADMGVVALHLEVARSNGRARRFYETLGFVARDRYHLMSCRL